MIHVYEKFFARKFDNSYQFCSSFDGDSFYVSRIINLENLKDSQVIFLEEDKKLIPIKILRHLDSNYFFSHSNILCQFPDGSSNEININSSNLYLISGESVKDSLTNSSNENLDDIILKISSYCPQFLSVYYFKLFLCLPTILKEDSSAEEEILFSLNLNFSSTLSPFFEEALSLFTDWCSNAKYQMNRKISPPLLSALSFLRRNLYSICQGLELYKNINTKNCLVIDNFIKKIIFQYINSTISSITKSYIQLCPSRVRFPQWQRDISYAIYCIEEIFIFLNNQISSLNELEEEKIFKDLDEFKGNYSLLLIFDILTRLDSRSIQKYFVQISKSPSINFYELIKYTEYIRSPKEKIILRYNERNHSFSVVEEEIERSDICENLLNPFDDYICPLLLNKSITISKEEFDSISSSTSSSVSIQDIRYIIFNRVHLPPNNLISLSLNDFDIIIDDFLELIDKFIEDHKFYSQNSSTSDKIKKDHSKCFLLHNISSTDYCPSWNYSLYSTPNFSSFNLSIKFKYLISFLICKRKEFWIEDYPELKEDERDDKLFDLVKELRNNSEK